MIDGDYKGNFIDNINNNIEMFHNNDGTLDCDSFSYIYEDLIRDKTIIEGELPEKQEAGDLIFMRGFDNNKIRHYHYYDKDWRNHKPLVMAIKDFLKVGVVSLQCFCEVCYNCEKSCGCVEEEFKKVENNIPNIQDIVDKTYDYFYRTFTNRRMLVSEYYMEELIILFKKNGILVDDIFNLIECDLIFSTEDTRYSYKDKNWREHRDLVMALQDALRTKYLMKYDCVKNKCDCISPDCVMNEFKKKQHNHNQSIVDYEAEELDKLYNGRGGLTNSAEKDIVKKFFDYTILVNQHSADQKGDLIFCKGNTPLFHYFDKKWLEHERLVLLLKRQLDADYITEQNYKDDGTVEEKFKQYKFKQDTKNGKVKPMKLKNTNTKIYTNKTSKEEEDKGFGVDYNKLNKELSKGLFSKVGDILYKNVKMISAAVKSNKAGVEDKYKMIVMLLKDSVNEVDKFLAKELLKLLKKDDK